MEIYVIFHYIHILSPFLFFSDMILSDALILPVSQLQTQQVMTSQVFKLCSLCRGQKPWELCSRMTKSE